MSLNVSHIKHKSSNVVRHCLSKIFQPSTIVPKTANMTRQDITSKSQRLMLEMGIIQQAGPGYFHFLPLALKSLNKLIKIVDGEMIRVGGQKVMFPILTNSTLWKNSGRLKDVGPELFQLKDRHNHNYILSPTHEEVASNLISSIAPLSYKQFPLRLYQISPKFRDEMKARFGLMRGREFIMKDMYCFDISVDSAKKTYEEICESYDNIFTKIGVEFSKVLGTSGNMGGNLSHEFHFTADVGEDEILFCKNCSYSANVELCGREKCPNCGKDSEITIQSGIEVGHTFFLGEKYSKPLKANYLDSNNKPGILQMGSYGLGLSRILAASVEVLSTEQEMRWPDSLAPFNIIILPPKDGSKEELPTKGVAETLYTYLEEQVPQLKDNILLDDRTSWTIGRRYIDAKRMGYRYIIVINQQTADAELYELNDLQTSARLYLSKSELPIYINKNTMF